MHMLEARPDGRHVDHGALALAIGGLHDVVSATTACADACLVHDDVAERTECIRSCANAADAAGALAKILTRTGATVQGTRTMVEATAKLLSEVAETTAAHGDHDKHCRICTETTRGAEQALAGLLTAMAEVDLREA